MNELNGLSISRALTGSSRTLGFPTFPSRKGYLWAYLLPREKQRVASLRVLHASCELYLSKQTKKRRTSFRQVSVLWDCQKVNIDLRQKNIRKQSPKNLYEDTYKKVNGGKYGFTRHLCFFQFQGTLTLIIYVCLYYTLFKNTTQCKKYLRECDVATRL